MSIGLCAIAKNEAPYLQEWVTYHLALGFDRIVLYDNESTDQGCSALARSTTFRDRVVVRAWPSINGIAQLAAYDDLLETYADAFEWMLILDVDEFLVLRHHRDVADFLEAFAAYDGVAINWKLFGSSDHRQFQPGLVLERFKTCSRADFEPNINIKSFFRPAAVQRASTHSPYFKISGRFVDQARNVLDCETGQANIFVTTVDYSQAQINHYFTKSFEEFVIKRNRGKADHAVDDLGKYRPLHDFDVYDRNEERDTTVLETPAFCRLKAEMLEQTIDMQADAETYRRACEEVGFWFHSVAFGGGRFTKGHKTRPHMESEAAAWRFPADLTGKTMLDIGCADGGWSVEGLRRGAKSVVAIDVQQTSGRRFLQENAVFPRIDFRTLDIYADAFLHLEPADFVLFAGVLYHLEDPLAALKRLHRVVAGICILETLLDESGGSTRPCAVFYEAGELNDDPTNWWGPNTACLEAWLRVAGFRHELTWRHVDAATGIGRASYLIARA